MTTTAHPEANRGTEMRTRPGATTGAGPSRGGIRRVMVLPRAASSPRRARAFVADVLDASGIASEIVERARLLVSELVTNAILHARSAATVTVEIRHRRVRVSVADSSRAMPRRRDPEPSECTGRGLHALDGLALRWGAMPTRHGKTVWFDLRAALAGRT